MLFLFRMFTWRYDLDGRDVAVISMNEKEDCALVPRPPSGLEKAEPGARRILSGIVADTLALAKKKPSSATKPPTINHPAVPQFRRADSRRKSAN
jgi:hypothetical protein